MSKKMTKKEFQNYIISEATKLYKIEVLKEEKKRIDDDYFAESKIKSVNEGATIRLNENTGDLDSQLSTASMIAAEKIMYDVSDRLSSVDKTFTDDYQNQEKMKVVWNEIEEKLSDTIFELFKNGINKLKDATTDLEANGGDEVKKQFDNMFDNPLGQLDDLSASFGPKNESKMTKQDFKNYIISEATKLYKIEVLKEEKERIIGQLKVLNEGNGDGWTTAIMNEDSNNLRGMLHTLVGNEMRLEKRADMYGVDWQVKEHEKAKQELENFLRQNPSMMEFKDEVEDHFMNQLYK